MKINFINVISKNADYIRIQVENFRKFIPNEFEYYVMNNARFDATEFAKIEQMSHSLGVHHEPVVMDEEINRISNGCGSVNDTTPNATYALNYFCSKVAKELTGLIVLIHSDMFFMRTTDIEALLDGNDACFVPRYEKDLMYMWDGFCVFNAATVKMDRLNWSFGAVEGKNTDCGGYTHYYLRDFAPSAKFIEAWNIVDVTKEGQTLKFDTHLNGNIRYYFDYDEQQGRLLNFRDQNGPVDASMRKKFAYEQPKDNYPAYYAEKFLGIYRYFARRGVALPNPYWIDVLMPAGSNDFVILHYKSGTNYMSFQNQSYNEVKLQALQKLL